jgi:hypothetical protein
MRTAAALVVLALAASACSAIEEETVVDPVDPVYLAAAEQLCPIMWEWQKNVGATMNTMSYEARREDDALERRSLYLRAFNRIRELNAQLDATVVSLGDEDPLSRITPDVRFGLEQSNSILEMSAAHVDRAYSEFDAPGYSDIVPTIFLDVEKVIDVAKPEMATYEDQELIDAFITVPQCQHGVKDANDGQVRYVP